MYAHTLKNTSYNYTFSFIPLYYLDTIYTLGQMDVSSILLRHCNNVCLNLIYSYIGRSMEPVKLDILGDINFKALDSLSEKNSIDFFRHRTAFYHQLAEEPSPCLMERKKRRGNTAFPCKRINTP